MRATLAETDPQRYDELCHLFGGPFADCDCAGCQDAARAVARRDGTNEAYVRSVEARESDNLSRTAARVQHDGEPCTAEQRIAEAFAWLSTLGRKCEYNDVTHDLQRAASEWLRRYSGDFAFLTDLKARSTRLSIAQAKGVLNCMRAESQRSVRDSTALRAAANSALYPSSNATVEQSQPAADERRTYDVPAARYAIEVDGAVKFYKIDRPTKGKWVGYTFVKQIVSDDEFPVRGAAAQSVLAAIDADVFAALALYGQEIGACGHCGRTLTSEWRKRGIGPVCAKNMGY